MVLTHNLFVMCTVALNVKLVSRDYNKLLNSVYIFHVLTFWQLKILKFKLGTSIVKGKQLSTSGNPFLLFQNWQKCNQRNYGFLRAIFLIFDRSQTLYWARKIKNTRIIGYSRSKYWLFFVFCFISYWALGPQLLYYKSWAFGSYFLHYMAWTLRLQKYKYKWAYYQGSALGSTQSILKKFLTSIF